MTDPVRWDTVFGSRLDADLPPVAPRAVPLVRTPTCPTHCSGRHEEEACIGCPGCGARLYRVLAHEWFHTEAHYFYTQEPIHDAPAGRTDCPACGGMLTRMP